MKPINDLAWKIWIDTGGTFTDCLAVDPAGNKTRIKVLSSSCLRGRIIRKTASGTYEFEANWNFEKDLLTGYFFRINALSLSGKITKLDHSRKTLTLDHDFSIPENADFEISTGEEAPVLAEIGRAHV